MSPPPQKEQGVKLCNLLSECPLFCLFLHPPSFWTAAPRGPEARRGPEREGGGVLSSLPPAPRDVPSWPGGLLAVPCQVDRPARALLVSCTAGLVLLLLSGMGWGGVAKKAPSVPRGSRMGQRVRGPPSSELNWMGGTVASGLSGLRRLQAAWPGGWRGDCGYGSDASDRARE